MENQECVVIRNYPKRVSHTSGEKLPTRDEITKSLIQEEAPLVSIVLLAYNKLDYTKQCIDSIYKYTEDVDYELILVDNGSADNTYDYFKTLSEQRPQTRVVHLVNNQGCIGGFNEGMKVAEGKYIATVCNDFIFTKRWLSNLVKCIESDPTIGYVSPAANYISNRQQVDLVFDNLEEMQLKAAVYNQSDPSKWEERIRLMPNVLMIRREVLQVVGYYDPLFYYGEFGDDDFSFRVRRAGYKLVFCNDTFVYHYGHVTVGVDQQQNNSLELSRKLFKDKYKGIDPWIDVVYDVNLVNLIDAQDIEPHQEVKVLAIAPRCGNILLMIKNKLKEKGINHVTLYAYTDNPLYYEDLQSICKNVSVGKIEDIAGSYQSLQFDYIVIAEPLNTFGHVKQLMENTQHLVTPKGKVICNFINSVSASIINKMLALPVNPSLQTYIGTENLHYLIEEGGLAIKMIVAEKYNLTEGQIKALKEVCHKIGSSEEEREGLLESLGCYRYLLNFSKQ